MICIRIILRDFRRFLAKKTLTKRTYKGDRITAQTMIGKKLNQLDKRNGNF